MSASHFHGDDPLLLGLQVSVDKRAVHAAEPEFCARELAPKVLQAFRLETTDPGLFRAFGDMGLPDSSLPPTYGKAGIGSFGLSEPDYGSDSGGLQTRTQEDMHAPFHWRAQTGIQAFTT